MFSNCWVLGLIQNTATILWFMLACVAFDLSGLCIRGNGKGMSLGLFLLDRLFRVLPWLCFRALFFGHWCYDRGDNISYFSCTRFPDWMLLDLVWCILISVSKFALVLTFTCLFIIFVVNLIIISHCHNFISGAYTLAVVLMILVNFYPNWNQIEVYYC